LHFFISHPLEWRSKTDDLKLALARKTLDEKMKSLCGYTHFYSTHWSTSINQKDILIFALLDILLYIFINQRLFNLRLIIIDFQFLFLRLRFIFAFKSRQKLSHKSYITVQIWSLTLLIKQSRIPHVLCSEVNFYWRFPRYLI